LQNSKKLPTTHCSRNPHGCCGRMISPCSFILVELYKAPRLSCN
jgi:hypothetical protein